MLKMTPTFIKPTFTRKRDWFFETISLLLLTKLIVRGPCFAAVGSCSRVPFVTIAKDTRPAGFFQVRATKKFWPLVFRGPRQKIVRLCKAGYRVAFRVYIIYAYCVI